MLGEGERRRAYWLALSKMEGLGRRRLATLVQACGSAEAAWNVEPGRLSELAGWGEKARRAFLVQRGKIDPVAEYLAVQRQGLRVWTMEDEEYPDLLRQIPDPPLVLYARGHPLPRETALLAVVGTRRATAYGRWAARRLARDLAKAGLGIVSGLARGIDTEAHLGALEGGGFTVAVLGCGVDVIYPPENARLYQAIATHGLVLSEFPPGTQPKPGHFPARNRLISGLARGVLVVEAGPRSGALITADLALEQGRDVFAVPGPINSPVSQGTNELIKQGAKLVAAAADVLEEYGLAAPVQSATRPAPPQLTAREREVLRLLGGGPVQIEELAELSGYNITELAGILTLLEVKGLVQQLPGKQFVVRPGNS